MSEQEAFFDREFDRYLDEVEISLAQAGTPPSERAEILDDVRTHIAELVAADAEAGVENGSIQSVLDRLAPPSDYASEQLHAPATQNAGIRLSPWAFAAAVAMATSLVFSLGFAALLVGNLQGPAVLAIGTLVGSIAIALLCFVPFALRLATSQIRLQPDRFRGRNVCISVATVYWALIPVLALVVICILTSGYALFALGIVLFVYVIQGRVKKVRSTLFSALPSDPPSNRSRTEKVGERSASYVERIRSMSFLRGRAEATS